MGEGARWGIKISVVEMYLWIGYDMVKSTAETCFLLISHPPCPHLGSLKHAQTRFSNQQPPLPSPGQAAAERGAPLAGRAGGPRDAQVALGGRTLWARAP